MIYANKRGIAIVALTAAVVAGSIGFAAGRATAEEKIKIEYVPMAATAARYQSQIKLTDEEREIVERVVAAESRGECYEGQAAVAEVIYNRCINRGQSVEDVALDDGQFAAPYGGDISDTTRKAVASVFDKGQLNLCGAEYFHADTMLPYWASHMQEVRHIGGHIFYKEVRNEKL